MFWNIQSKVCTVNGCMAWVIGVRTRGAGGLVWCITILDVMSMPCTLMWVVCVSVWVWVWVCGYVYMCVRVCAHVV